MSLVRHWFHLFTTHCSKKLFLVHSLFPILVHYSLDLCLLRDICTSFIPCSLFKSSGTSITIIPAYHSWDLYTNIVLLQQHCALYTNVSCTLTLYLVHWHWALHSDIVPSTVVSFTLILCLYRVSSRKHLHFSMCTVVTFTPILSDVHCCCHL